MKTEVVSMQLQAGTVKRLRHLAHQVSLEWAKDTTWPAIVRELIEATLPKAEDGKKSG
jgi:hypothetical protein